MRALYLSRIHALPISKFALTLGVAYLMHTVANGLLALIGLVAIALSGGPAHFGLLLFFMLITLAGIVAMSIDGNVNGDRGRFPKAQIHSLLSAWQSVRVDRLLIVKLWFLMLALALATVWQCRIAFDALSVQLPWSGILLYAGSKNLATLISLTPGSLGIVELISIYLGTVLDYSTANALSVQALIRAVAIGALLLLGPVAIYFLRRNLARSSTTSGGVTGA